MLWRAEAKPLKIGLEREENATDNWDPIERDDPRRNC